MEKMPYCVVCRNSKHTAREVQVSDLQKCKECSLSSLHLGICALLHEATQLDQLFGTFGKSMPVQKWCWSTPGIMVQMMKHS
jgi:hypothetical protein